MNYKQQEIKHINQILPLIESLEEFLVIDKGDYIYIDYLIEKENTFSNPLLLECRGIKFDKEGNILARPLHKFFNVNQKINQTDINWQIPHTITDKLDGSMIHSAYINNELVLMTRAGITDQSILAEKQTLDDRYRSFCEYCEDNFITPIFEFISPNNRIVIKYKEKQLVLLTARHKISGIYLTRGELVELADKYQIPLVDVRPSVNQVSYKDFIEYTRALIGVEGFIIQFHDGFTVKIKADDYVLKHRVKSYFDHEKYILEAVVTDKIDDLIGLSDEEDDKIRLVSYSNAVVDSLISNAKNIFDLINGNSQVTKKEFATVIAKDFDHRLKPTLFWCFDRKINNIEEIVKELKNVYFKWCFTQSNIDKNRDLIGTTW